MFNNNKQTLEISLTIVNIIIIIVIIIYYSRGYLDTVYVE